MNNLLRHTHRSGTRFFLNLRTNSSVASESSTCLAPIHSNAKVIYSLAPAMGHHKTLEDDIHLRVPSILGALENAKLTPEFRGSEIIQLQDIRTATLEDITSVHSRSYLSSLEKAVDIAKASEHGILQIEDSEPTYVTGTTLKDSLVAAGAGLSLVDAVVAASNVNENPPIGFSLVRPPGHHAVREGAKGYCFLGNVAIAARYAQRTHGLKRVFIIDFDVHHGNGTNDAFYDDPDIFYLSTHQDGGYPSRYPHDSGKFDDIGCGNGEGATLNVPLPDRTGDIAMRTVFDEVIVPSAQRFKPDIILVSAGYDGHVIDPTGGFQLTTATYHMLASSIKQLAKDLCGGRCVFFLEGGYFSTLAYSVAESFRAFIGEPGLTPDYEKKYASFLQDEPSDKINLAIQRIKHLHSL